MNIKQGDAWTLIGPCLICGEELTTKDGELNCYNPECQEYRKNLVVPEGWKITPFEKGFKYPVEGQELTLEEQIEKFSCGWTDEQLQQLGPVPWIDITDAKEVVDQ